ncbi:hypothetical protein ACR0ST_02240 [Aliidiomarina sp. Khilg15.8]
MKFRVLTLAVLAAGSMGMAQANNEINVKETKTLERPQAAQGTTFGTYRVLPGAKVQSTGGNQFDLGAATQAGQNVQAQSLSSAELEDVKPVAGNVVFNEITNDYGVLTGHLSVLVSDKASVREVAQQFGLQVETSEDRIGLGLLSAAQDTDLVALADAIRESGLVRAVEIDVQEHLNKPHY